MSTDFESRGTMGRRSPGSNGQAFEDLSFRGLDRGYCNRDEITLTDMNGDGRADVTCRTNGLVALSTGTVFSITASGGQWCNYYDRLPDAGRRASHEERMPTTSMRRQTHDGHCPVCMARVTEG